MDALFGLNQSNTQPFDHFSRPLTTPDKSKINLLSLNNSKLSSFHTNTQHFSSKRIYNAFQTSVPDIYHSISKKIDFLFTFSHLQKLTALLPMILSTKLIIDLYQANGKIFSNDPHAKSLSTFIERLSLRINGLDL